MQTSASAHSQPIWGLHWQRGWLCPAVRKSDRPVDIAAHSCCLSGKVVRSGEDNVNESFKVLVDCGKSTHCTLYVHAQIQDTAYSSALNHRDLVLVLLLLTIVSQPTSGAANGYTHVLCEC